MDGTVTGVDWVAPQSSGPTISIDISFWTAVKVGAGLVVGGGLISIVLWVMFAALIMIGLSLPAVR
jgi:hypothetical protein